MPRAGFRESPEEVDCMLSVIRSFFSRDFHYSSFHRALEIFAILGFFALVAVISYRAALGIADIGWTAVWVVPMTAFLGYLVADFASGFVHWLGDTYGDENTPVLGEGFIKPFRHHHVDPQDIVAHDWVEVNGNNSIVLALYMVPVALIFTDPTSMIHLFILSMSVFFTLGVFMTNQFHKWSHMEKPPPSVAKLQQWGIILGQEHHNVHHTAPFDTYYCITCGWLNPPLRRIQFFETIEGILRRFFGLQTSREKSEAI